MVYQRPLRSDELMHFGIKGQKWGRRRFQNIDGTYTMAGRARYGLGERMNDTHPFDSPKDQRMKYDYNRLTSRHFKQKYDISKNRFRKDVNKYGDPVQTTHDASVIAVKELGGKALKAAYGVSMLALGTYGLSNSREASGKAALAAAAGMAIAKRHMKKHIARPQYNYY